MEVLGINNILGQEDIEELFTDEVEETTTETKENDSPEGGDENSETTEELNTEGLFETPESVGSEEHQEGEDTVSEKKTGSSPKTNFYSSIAKALKEDGVLPDLDDEVADSIKDPEDFAKAVEDEINKRLDEKQRRIDEALNNGVESSVIKQYESTLSFLNSITEEALSAETEEGETLRKNLIYQDLINRGYSKEDAIDELKEVFDNGSDLKRAKRALNGNKEFFKSGYQKELDEAKERAEDTKKERERQDAALKKSILEDKNFFGDLRIDNSTRQKIYSNISKPVYKDKETGEFYTALQKYEKENRLEFLKNVGLIYTLTDGFKSLDGLIKNKVKEEKRKGIRELEHTLNNTSRNSDGNIRFVSGVSDDPESFIGKDWNIDI